MRVAFEFEETNFPQLGNPRWLPRTPDGASKKGAAPVAPPPSNPKGFWVFTRVEVGVGNRSAAAPPRRQTAPGVAVASPPLWSEDQGFLPDQRRPTGSLAGIHAGEHQQQESCREEGTKEKQTFGILQQADESATPGHLRRRPAARATRAPVNTPANVTGRADDAASPPRAAAPAFPDPARSADDGIPATAHSLQAPARPRWRGGREGRQRQPSRPSRDQPPAWPPSSMQPRQESSARRSPPPPSPALWAFVGSDLRGRRGRGDQGREAAAAGVRVSPPGRLRGGDAREVWGVV
jgi:hypothetical protein